MPATRIGPDFFQTIRTPVVRGRRFGPGDGAGSERVVIMTERLADVLFPGQDALGRRITVAFDSGAREMTVVGIAALRQLVLGVLARILFGA